MDNAIEDLITPLGQLKEEVLSLKISLDVAISSMDSRLSLRAELREKKVSMICFTNCIPDCCTVQTK